MRVVVVGCGRVGSTLAARLDRNESRVTVIDKNPAAFSNLPLDFRGRTIAGDVLAQGVLHRAEIEKADALAAVTNSDSLNALMAHIARTEYQVPRVVARNYDPKQWQLQAAFEVPIIGSAVWGAERIHDLLSDEPILSLFLDPTAKIELCQISAPEAWVGKTLQELFPDGRISVLSLVRVGRAIPVSEAGVIEAGDLLYLSGEPEEIRSMYRSQDHAKEQVK
jgi:trk system potassium uptake protein TrkA